MAQVYENELRQYLTINGLDRFAGEIFGIMKQMHDNVSKNSIKIERVTSKNLLPSVGDGKTIYIETTNKQIYLWDDKLIKYYVFGSDYHSIKVINGGTAK